MRVNGNGNTGVLVDLRIEADANRPTDGELTLIGNGSNSSELVMLRR
jgi:hypothetical protein